MGFFNKRDKEAEKYYRQQEQHAVQAQQEQKKLQLKELIRAEIENAMSNIQTERKVKDNSQSSPKVISQVLNYIDILENNLGELRKYLEKEKNGKSKA